MSSKKVVKKVEKKASVKNVTKVAKKAARKAPAKKAAAKKVTKKTTRDFSNAPAGLADPVAATVIQVIAENTGNPVNLNSTLGSLGFDTPAKLARLEVKLNAAFPGLNLNGDLKSTQTVREVIALVKSKLPH